jgi:exonuclease III
MKIISWNIRGLNGRSKQKMLRDMIIEEAPDIVMLQETKCTTEDINRLLPYLWKQGEVVSIDAMGTAGGLALLWNTNSTLMDTFYTTRWSITAAYRLIGSDKPGHLTTVYGPATPRDKQTFLESLNYLSSLNQHHNWIVGGDFNIIRSLEEKKGGSRRLDRDSDAFNNLIDDLSLVDLEAINGTHTWTNRRTGTHQIACKLDRFLVSEPTILDGTAVETTILNRTGSDHWPIQLWMEVPATPGKKPFRFEQFWLDHPDFQANIQGWWKEAEINHGTKMYRFQQKLKNLKLRLKSWNRHTFGNIFETQKQLTEQMNEIQCKIREQGFTEELKNQELKVTQQLEDRKRQEEILWKQKSRIQWLKEGDRNTKFFHRATIQRRHSNKITHLVTEEGETLHSHAELESHLIDYFQNLLSEPLPNRSEAIRQITKCVPALVTQEQNAALLRPFTLEELDQALLDTPKCKAPGPDGFTSDFFHYCWQMIRTEVWEILEDSRLNGEVLRAFNATFLALIPKEGQANRPKQFRPIALCNVIYKLLTKVIASRLKPILPTIISPEQSGYVEGRQILDSIMGSPTAKEALSLKDILQLFSDASGLECNKDKSQIFFFNTPLPIQLHISELLGFNRSSLPSKYLGIPLIDSAHKNSSWEHLLSTFAKKLSSWTFRTLNLPSRLVLLKAILQALPIYAFSVLAAPRSVLNTIKSLQRTFLWHGPDRGKKLALVSWETICKTKDQGGLGIRDPSSLNQVLSAKIWWRWLKNPTDLWAKLWRKKYAPNTAENNLIRWNGDAKGSLIWNAAKQNRQLVMQHSFWEIGNGQTALFWQDSWQQWPALNAEDWSKDMCAQATGAGLTKVADYWQNNHGEGTWRCWHLDRERIIGLHT